jgi:WD40 repeat protein
MQVLKVLIFTLILSLQALSQAELQIKSEIPLDLEKERWIYLPKTRQVLILRINSSEFWDVETGKLLRTSAPMNFKYIWEAEKSPDEEKILFHPFIGKEAELWDIGKGKLIAVLPKQPKDIDGVEWSSDNRYFILKNSPYDLGKEHRVWDGATGQIKSVIKTKFKSAAEFSPDGKTILTTEIDISIRKNNHLKLWDASSGNLLKELIPSESAQSVRAYFAPNGKCVLVDDGDKIFTRNINTSQTETVFAQSNEKKRYRAVKFSPDGKFLLIHKALYRGFTKHDETTFEIYDAETGALKIELKTQKPEKNQVELGQVVWRPDGKALVSAGEYYQKKYEAESWDVLTGKQKFVLSPLTAKLGIKLFGSGYDTLDRISFTPDSRFLITDNLGKEDYLRIWDAETGHLLRAFSETEGRYNFTPDKKYLYRLDETKKELSFYELTVK